MRPLEPGEAAYLSGLPEDHPDRVAAMAGHADDAAFARALEDGARLQSLLGQYPPADPVAPEVLTRVEASVVAAMDDETAPADPHGFGWPAWLPLTAAAVLWLALASRHFTAGKDPGLLLASVGVAALGAGGLAVGLAFARPAVGARTLGVIVATSLAAAAALADWGAAPALVGLKCAIVEIGGTIVPLVLLGGLYLRHHGRPGALRFAVVAAAGALVVQAAVELGCPAPGGIAHALAFHGGGVALAAVLGATLGASLSRRPAPT